MPIRVTKTPDVHVSASELNRLRYEYQQAFQMYCGPKPDFAEWVISRLKDKRGILPHATVIERTA